VELVKVEKAAGPDAYTVSEIHEKVAALNEKTAVVKGQVIKVSSGILGKNWIHLQDGTGDASLGTNKLVTTSDDLPAVGDVVTMKGTVHLDKDFGAGYKYHVIMEKASIQR
jgi:predicted GTPase